MWAFSETDVWVGYGHGLATRSAVLELSLRRSKTVLGFGLIGQAFCSCFVIGIFIGSRGVFWSSLLFLGSVFASMLSLRDVVRENAYEKWKTSFLC